MRAASSFFMVLVQVRAREIFENQEKSRLSQKKERKKENTQPKGGMGGRHAATTQGF